MMAPFLKTKSELDNEVNWVLILAKLDPWIECGIVRLLVRLVPPRYTYERFLIDVLREGSLYGH
jgi:hypothetical protein